MPLEVRARVEQRSARPRRAAATRRWSLLVVLLLGGCGGDLLDTDTDVPTVLPELEGDAILPAAPVTTAPAPAPAWSTDAALPPASQLPFRDRMALRDAVCFGADPSLFERVRVRLRAEGLTDWPASSWAELLLDGCRSPAAPFCDWVGDQVRALPDGAQPDDGLFTLWHLAGGCADPEVWTWMPRSGGALYGTADYLAAQDNLWRPVTDPEVPGWMAPILEHDDAIHRSAALQAIGAVDQPEAARVLLEHHGGLATEEQRDPVALWMYRQSDPRARAVFVEACARNPGAWQCVEGVDPLADLQGAIAAGNVDLSALLTRYPDHRGAVLDALVRCLEDGARGMNAQGGRCLRALAGAGESDRATRALADVDEAVLDPYWVSRRKAWLELDGLEMGTALAERGAIPETRPEDPSEPPVYVVDWFLDAERGVVLGTQSNRQALTRLLAQVPELRGAAVDGRSPLGDAAVEPLDELFVWLEPRERIRVVTRPWSGDDQRLAAFANALAEREGLDTRFVAVAPGQLIVWGPEAALRQLVDEGLLDAMEP